MTAGSLFDGTLDNGAGEGSERAVVCRAVAGQWGGQRTIIRTGTCKPSHADGRITYQLDRMLNVEEDHGRADDAERCELRHLSLRKEPSGTLPAICVAPLRAEDFHYD